MPLASVNGLQQFYTDTHPNGEQNLPVLIFLHGAMGNSMSWWQNIAVLRCHLRCIAIDCRGYGRTPDPTGEGLSRYVDDLEAFMDHLKLVKVCLVCQSMGGRTGLAYTARHPERVDALIMGACWGSFDWPEQDELAMGTPKPPPPKEGFIRGLATKFQENEPALTLLWKYIGDVLPGPKPKLSGPTPGGPSLEQVKTLAVPVLCIVGELDPIFPPPVVKAFADVLPNSEYVEVAGGGHSVYWEQPAFYNDTVLNFLKKRIRIQGVVFGSRDTKSAWSTCLEYIRVFRPWVPCLTGSA